jgi:hypothetical protein
MNMELGDPSETPVPMYQTTRSLIPEYRNRNAFYSRQTPRRLTQLRLHDTNKAL